jgi:ribulose bisphosphate carboxylase small subunit
MYLVQQRVLPVAPLPGHDGLEKLVNRSLCHDWVIRVEHMGQDEAPHGRWQEWEKPLFAINAAEPVMEAIYSCHAANPGHTIRMHAEKVRPKTRFIYTVYNAPVSSPGKMRSLPLLSSNLR